MNDNGIKFNDGEQCGLPSTINDIFGYKKEVPLELVHNLMTKSPDKIEQIIKKTCGFIKKD